MYICLSTYGQLNLMRYILQLLTLELWSSASLFSI